MPSIKAPANLPELVRTSFNRAKSNGDLNYYATQVTILTPNSIPFQLRFSPALANKPTAPRPKPSSPHKPFDPFESPENGPLFIADVAPAHNLVLNKFAIVPEHFILATKQFKEQTHLLEADDLAATYACIEAYDDGKGEGGLFAFFNSGPHSGASQPHRHIQLLPIARMKDGLDAGSGWEVLADKLVPQAAETGGVAPPFGTFGQRISPDMSAHSLHQAYLALYREAEAAVQKHVSSANATASTSDAAVSGNGNSETGEGGGASAAAAKISYNMAMTRTSLVICPRVSEGGPVADAAGVEVGSVALNGTMLAGTALVKNEAEWEALRQAAGGHGEAQLSDILSRVGIPRAGVAGTRL